MAVDSATVAPHGQASSPGHHGNRAGVTIVREIAPALDDLPLLLHAAPPDGLERTCVMVHSAHMHTLSLTRFWP